MKLMTIILALWTATIAAQSVNPPGGILYDTANVNRVDIIIPADSLAWLYLPENRWNNDHIRGTFVYSYGNQQDTIEDIGFRLRGNTSRSASKKSFKVSFNTYVAGRKYQGVEKLNLNGQHNDPSVYRARLCSEILYDMNLYTIRSSHVEVYVNNDYYGLYVNTEHIDEEYALSRFGNNDGNLYKCTYPADLIYKGDDPSLYDLDHLERPPYELKTNEDVRDFSDLAQLIDVLNNTPIVDFPCEIEEIFDVDNYLKYIVFDLLTGNWDGPLFNKNNFYLYHDTKTGLIQYLPFDLDNTFGIDWFGIDWANRDIYSWSPDNEFRPLYEKIMAVPEYRDRFTYYMGKTLDEAYELVRLQNRTEEISELLLPYLTDDQFYTATYGFSTNDFINSFLMPLDYNHTPYGIVPFLEQRSQSARNQLEAVDIHPIIEVPTAEIHREEKTIQIATSIEDDGTITEAIVTYRIDGAPEVTVLLLNTSNGYEATIPIDADTESFEYFIAAIDDVGQIARQPICSFKQVAVRRSELTLAINEILASNGSSVADEAGDFDDWIELYNYGEEAIDLADFTLTDNASEPNKWVFPAHEIAAGEYLLVWCDDDEDQGPLHTTFKLSKDGEYVGLFDADGALIDEIDFPELQEDEVYARVPDGIGEFVVQAPTPAASNLTSSTTEIQTEQLHLYPTVTKGFLHIEVDAGIEIEELVVVSAAGEVTTINLTKESYELDVSHLPKGVYFAEAKDTDGRIHLGRFVRI